MVRHALPMTQTVFATLLDGNVYEVYVGRERDTSKIIETWQALAVGPDRFVSTHGPGSPEVANTIWVRTSAIVALSTRRPSSKGGGFVGVSIGT